MSAIAPTSLMNDQQFGGGLFGCFDEPLLCWQACACPCSLAADAHGWAFPYASNPCAVCMVWSMWPASIPQLAIARVAIFRVAGVGHQTNCLTSCLAVTFCPLCVISTWRDGVCTLRRSLTLALADAVQEFRGMRDIYNPPLRGGAPEGVEMAR